MQLLRHLTAPRRPGRHPAGDLPVELGVHDVAEPQFEPPEDLVLERGAHLHVPRGGEHHVDPVAQTARGDVRDDRLQRLVRGPETAPAVDDQEHVTPRLTGKLSESAHAPVRGDGVDALRPEELLAPGQYPRHLRDRAPHPLRIQP